MERELAEHAKDLDDRFYGPTRKSLQELAFKLTERRGTSHPFKSNQAGRAWAKGFIARKIGKFQGKMCIPCIYIVVLYRQIIFSCVTVLKPFFL
jgi:hypothetical protein